MRPFKVERQVSGGLLPDLALQANGSNGRNVRVGCPVGFRVEPPFERQACRVGGRHVVAGCYQISYADGEQTPLAPLSIIGGGI